MKKIIAIGFLSLALASCGASKPLTETGKNEPTIQKQVAEGVTVKEGDTVAVDYIGRFPDGTVFDSSIQEEAKKAPDYKPRPSYAPFVLTVKEGGGSIEGFWKAIVGMKVGEKKTVTLEPKDAYGDAWVTQKDTVVSKKLFDPTIEQKIPLSETKDKIPMQIPREVLEGRGSLPKVGDILSNAQGVSAKVISIDDKNVSVEVDNANNPFKGKKIAVGTTVTFEGNPAKITAVDDKNLTLLVTNKTNPFAGKTLEAGLEGMYGDSQKVKIVKLDGDNVTVSVSVKNTHPMAGKTLVFDLEVKEIKATK